MLVPWLWSVDTLPAEMVWLTPLGDVWYHVTTGGGKPENVQASVMTSWSLACWVGGVTVTLMGS